MTLRAPGAAQLARDVDRVADQLGPIVAEPAAELLAEALRSTGPRRTGRLLAGIRADADGAVVDVDYAIPVAALTGYVSAALRRADLGVTTRADAALERKLP